MSAILKFDFQTTKQLRFSEVNYLNYTKRPNFACDNYIFPKINGITRTSSGPIPLPLKKDFETDIIDILNFIWYLLYIFSA